MLPVRVHTSSRDETPGLWKRIRSGDDSALDELLETIIPDLDRYAHQRLPRSLRRYVDADDVVSETCISVVKNARSFPGTSLSETLGWARLIADRKIYEFLRYYGHVKNGSWQIVSLDQLRELASIEPMSKELAPDLLAVFLEELIAAVRLPRDFMWVH